MTTPTDFATWAEISGVASYIFMIAGHVLILAAIAHMLRHQRSPSGAIAWLIAIIMLPQVGVPLYILIGGRKAIRRAQRKARIKLPHQNEFDSVDDSRIHMMLTKQGIPGASSHNRVRLLTTPDAGYHGLVDIIESAQKTLHISTFIFGYDRVARDILGRLCRRASEGVQVRLLVDGLGSIKTGRFFFRPLTAAGGRFAVFSPVFAISLRRRTVLRNHRKIAVADGWRVMSGGMNIFRHEVSPEPVPGAWVDLAFLLEGRDAVVYADVFRSDWYYACGEELPPDDVVPRIEPDMEALTQVVPSGPDVPGDPLYEAILTAVFDARERLWLVTPYFVPDEALAQALRIACGRGVDVRLTVPRRSNHPLADIARSSFCRDIVKAGGTVRFHDHGLLHAKALLMDDRLAMVGSANFDMRSFFLNYEIMQLFYSRPEIDALTNWMQWIDQASTNGIEPAGVAREMVEGVTRMAAPML